MQRQLSNMSINNIKIAVDWNPVIEYYDYKIIAKGIYKHFIYLNNDYCGDDCFDEITCKCSGEILFKNVKVRKLIDLYNNINKSDNRYLEIIKILHTLPQFRNEILN